MKEAIASYKIICKGAPVFRGLSGRDVKHKRVFVNNLINEKKVEASVTVYRDGSRDIGCPFLGKYGDKYQRCIKFSEYSTGMEEELCIHLKPSSSE